MDDIAFEGLVATGVGKHKDLKVPGRTALLSAPPDWPEVLFPGSLNVRVFGYPKAFAEHGLLNRVEELDRELFLPAFEIPRHLMVNNKLEPRPGVPRGGDAQVWRALLRCKNGLTLSCWTLRRFGSRVGEQLELVAPTRLRDFRLDDGDRVVVSLSGTWRSS